MQMTGGRTIVRRCAILSGLVAASLAASPADTLRAAVDGRLGDTIYGEGGQCDRLYSQDHQGTAQGLSMMPLIPNMIRNPELYECGDVAGR